MKDTQNSWLHNIIIILIAVVVGASYRIFINEKPKNNKESVVNSGEIIEKTIQNEEKPIENEEKLIKPIENQQKTELTYRLTSYWTGDEMSSTNITGSGLTTDKFQMNEFGWYTYQGKLVLAGATNECLKSQYGNCGKWNMILDGKYYFNYYDEIEIMIDGVIYNGIILDSCGGCMYITYENRIDLFVSNVQYAIDRGYLGNNPVSVFLGVN